MYIKNFSSIFLKKKQKGKKPDGPSVVPVAARGPPLPRACHTSLPAPPRRSNAPPHRRGTRASSATGSPYLPAAQDLPAGAAPPLRRHAAPPPATRLPTAVPRCPTAAAGPAPAAGIRRAGSEMRGKGRGKREREERKNERWRGEPVRNRP